LQASVRGVFDLAVETVLDVHQKISLRFPPSASRFHYQFNMRTIAAVRLFSIVLCISAVG